MSEISRRQALTVLSAASFVAVLPRPMRAHLPPHVLRAARAAEDALLQGGYEPKFFTPSEWRAVRLLADLIIPRDERSGSASDAGVPEFLDFTVDDREGHQVPIRGGLEWLDDECTKRFGQRFVDCTDAQHAQILDAIAWPDRAESQVSQGVAFFNRFRDLVATGFFTSKMGIEDLQYMGNTYVTEWTGCPPEACRHLGVSYGG